MFTDIYKIRKKKGIKTVKILIFSDSHGKSENIIKAASLHPDAEYIVHLGDGAHDVTHFEKAVYIAVRGNCDMFSPYPFELIEKFDTVPVLISHGNRYFVKEGTSAYEAYAREKGVKVALFGHTHRKFLLYRDGLYLFNPGSISKYDDGGCSYGIMNVKNGSVLLSHGRISY